MQTRSGTERRRLNAAQFTLLGYGALVLAGAMVLAASVSARGEPLGFIDALFTSASAVCVTGLTVVDTGSKFTGFGQGVILSLIQVGGFGIMTLSTFLIIMIGRRAAITLTDAAAQPFLPVGRQGLKTLIVRAAVFTFLFEAAAAAVLFGRFRLDFSTAEALRLSVFHSISAFCNAGFSLFPDSLVRYADDPVVNATVMLLIIAGGIGFFIINDLWLRIRTPGGTAYRKIALHTKMVLASTAILIVGGTAVFYAIEHGHNLADRSFGQGLMHSLFLSVTARTAGFNTISTEHLSNSSLFTLIVLMMIGGAPGSMAGGVKVTTASVIVIVVISKVRGMRAPSLFRRSITREDSEKALSLMMLSGTLVGFAVMLLLITELGSVSHLNSRGLFLELVFECVSAFGTVGLSTGYTPLLTPTGRVIITMLMFIGRLGPLTLVYAMERRAAKKAFEYPYERILIG